MRRVPWLHLVLFGLTLLSTLTVGALHEGSNLIERPYDIARGIPFSFSILFILLAHEFSHYRASRHHHVDATLPYFLPAPTLFGTLGAFIKMKSPITSRNALMDIGASGPVAGFLVAVAASVIGLSLSSVMPVPRDAEVITLGDSLLFSFLSKLILGPVPEGHDVFLHPVAFAGWIGFFVTSMNLLPVGQLDGGHIMYALIGERHAVTSKTIIAVMVGMGIFTWEGWLVWGALLLILGLKHPPIVYGYLPLDPRRKMLGIASLVIFVLTFTPVPVMIR
ncbi:MAG: site-2 protease family protein [Thermodesulfovibrionales bacterium]